MNNLLIYFTFFLKAHSLRVLRSRLSDHQPSLCHLRAAALLNLLLMDVDLVDGCRLWLIKEGRRIETFVPSRPSG